MASPMATRPITRFDDATATTSNVDLMMAVVLGAAAAWVVSALGTPLVFEPSNPEFDPLIVLALILVAIGVFYLVRGTRRRSVIAGFGTTVFDQGGQQRLCGRDAAGPRDHIASIVGCRRLRAACALHRGQRRDDGRDETAHSRRHPVGSVAHALRRQFARRHSRGVHQSCRGARRCEVRLAELDPDGQRHR